MTLNGDMILVKYSITRYWTVHKVPDVFITVAQKQMPFSISVQFPINISIINVSVWVIDNSISDQKMLLPLSFYSSSIKISKLPMSMKLLAKKGTFIWTLGFGINHFSRYSDSVLVSTFEFVSIIAKKFHLSVKFCFFWILLSYLWLLDVWIVFTVSRRTGLRT